MAVPPCATLRRQATTVPNLIRKAVRDRYVPPVGDRKRALEEILRLEIPMEDWTTLEEEIERSHVEVACDLLESYPHLKTRDAVHAATMLNNGIQSIITSDGHFEDLKDLRWLPLTEQ